MLVFCYNWDPCNIGNAYPTWPRAPEFSKGKKSKQLGKSTELFRDIKSLKFRVKNPLFLNCTSINIKRFVFFVITGYSRDPCNVSNTYWTCSRAPEFSKGKKSKQLGKYSELLKSTFFKLRGKLLNARARQIVGPNTIHKY